MCVGFEHKVEESMGKSIEAGVDIRTSDVVGGMRSGGAREFGSGVGDDDRDNDKRGARSIQVAR